MVRHTIRKDNIIERAENRIFYHFTLGQFEDLCTFLEGKGEMIQ